MLPVGMFLGAAVGAAITYAYKDDSTKAWLVKSSDDLKSKASSLVASFKTKAEPEEAEAEVQVITTSDTASEVTPPKESVMEVTTEEIVVTPEQEIPVKNSKSKGKSTGKV